MNSLSETKNLKPDHDAPARILLVDDNPKNLQLLTTMLEKNGYVVHQAISGELALKYIQSNTPDLVLLDIRMTGLNGFEVCEKLKQENQTAAIPIIFISASGEISDKIKGFQVGGLDYITKPFQIEEVLARVRTHVTLRETQQSLEQKNSELKTEINLRLEAEQALKKAYDEVEIKVQKRTLELDTANKHLVKEIKERKKAEADLKIAIQELDNIKNRLQKENIYLQEEIKLTHNFGEFVGDSPAIKKIFKQIEQVAPSDTTVLFLGETGTGKELLARAVHNLSKRKDQPLIKVNCAALPANLIESELFGHEKGAFTGANARKIGRFELAHNGTIFLDEIGDLPLELQAKLLRTLQEGEIERLGGTKTIKIDVRVEAATNRDLEKACEDGSFRSDLFYRLNVFPITSPPLRNRIEDIPSLVKHFMTKFNKKIGKNVESISQQSMQKLKDYHWPGNVRELENIIERAIVLSSGKNLELGNWFSKEAGQLPQLSTLNLDEKQKEHILEVLKMVKWRIRGKNGAASLLGMKPTTLESRMQKLGIHR